jgi:predicted MPP superfamily phosphohydrolase
LALFGFVGLILLIVVLLHLYLWKRLVRDPLRPGWPRRVGGLVAVLLAILVPATLIGVRSGHVEWLAWPGYLWLALMFYLFVVLVVLEVPRLIVALLIRGSRRSEDGSRRSDDGSRRSDDGSRRSDDGSRRTEKVAARTDETAPAAVSGPTAEAADEKRAADNEVDAARAGTDSGGIERRLLLARGTAIVAGLTAAGITGYGVRTALGPPQVNRVRIPLAKLPRRMDGTRLAVVSDIHLGPLTGSHHVGRIVDVINSVDADIVCVVGDLVDGTVAELGRFAQPLANIRSRRGAYFVTGNHEYYSGFQPWVDEVARLGVRPLRNERLELDGLDLAGVNDLGGADYGDGPDFAKALADRDTARPVVLMAHQPVVAREAARYGVDLQVSGHTHGGQMVPFNLLVRLQQPIVSGLGTVDGVPVFVTNGAGFWGPPVRVGAPPQVTVIDLHMP